MQETANEKPQGDDAATPARQAAGARRSVVDEKKLNEFLGKFLEDSAAALNMLLVYVGGKTGLYQAMAEAEGPLTAEELASRTKNNARMVREWLSAQAVNGYVLYEPKTDAFSLPVEVAFVLVNEKSPVFLQGGVETTVSLYKDEEKIMKAMKTGKGLGWGAHNPAFYSSQDKLSRPGYAGNLVQTWIPALEGVEAKLKTGGATVAEIGCGSGFALIQMAKSYPDSSFVGFDFDGSLIERARAMAASEGVSHNTRFEVADATDYPADDYDLITFFSCLHDMGDPEGALSHAYESLKKRRGTLMIGEAPAGDRLEENFTPTGRILYCVSTMECVPASLDQDGIGLGTLMGEARLRDMVASKGFTNFRRIAGTPLLNVYEARVVS